MGAMTMPKSEIHRTSASSIGRVRLGDNDMPIEISNISICDCGSEMKHIGMIEHDLIILNSNTVTLHTSEVKKREKVTAKVRNMKDIMENHRDVWFTSNKWLKLHRPYAS